MFTKPFIIAEIGHNHGGSVEVCKKLFYKAAVCGVTAVKLQKRDNKSLFTEEFFNKPYDNPNSYGRTYGEHREALEFGHDEYIELKEYAESLGLIFFSTPFDVKSADFLEDIDIPIYKIASADLTNIQLIEHVASFKKPMIISTGGGSWEDVDRVYNMIDPSNTVFLHCIASYPNQPEDMNLRIIPAMRERYPDLAAVGLSDHYNGIVMAEVAYVLGGTVIEKHFTLNHTWKGTDHALSLEPQGMESLVHNIQRINTALGSDTKDLLPSEYMAVEKMGKSLYLSSDIKKGKEIYGNDIVIKSPGGGIPPYEINNVIGRYTTKSLCAGEMLKAGDYA